MASRAPAIGRLPCRAAQCAVTRTPALWATSTTGPSTSSSDLVELGDPLVELRVLPAERRHVPGAGQGRGQARLPVVLDVARGGPGPGRRFGVAVIG